MGRYTVFGNPIAHSKSPSIHHLFAEQAGLTIEYDCTFATKENFIPTLTDFFLDENAKGCNVTSPFKEQVAKWVNVLSANAKLAGAARGVLQSMLALDPSLLIVANRTEEKAQNLASLLPQDNFIGIGLKQLNTIQRPFDLIINSTSASLAGELPCIPDSVISSCANFYDMSYGDKPTVFIQYAKKLGVFNTFDGLGMLVGQAAESFYLWTGYRPDVAPVIRKLRSSL
jgi:shikimate dehydrogenase